MTQKRVVERTVVDPSPEPQSEIGRPPQNAIDASAKSNAPDRAEKYVPSGRPPVPTLCMLDNASDTNGEFFRLRDKITILGRVEGNVLVSDDPDVSARHARIERHAALGCYRWKLVDEASTNGTYVRRSHFVLGQVNEMRSAPASDVNASTRRTATAAFDCTTNPKAVH